MNDSLDLPTSPGQREVRKRDPEKLKSVKRNHAAQLCVAPLKDAAPLRLMNQRSSELGILKGRCSYFAAKRGKKKR